MKNRGNIVSGLILILIGLFWLMTNLGIISWSLFDVMFRLWPVTLIVIGINVIFRDKRSIRYVTWGIFLIIIIVFGFYQQYRFGKDVLIKSNENLVVEKPLETTSGELELQLYGGNVRIDSTNEKLIDAKLLNSSSILKKDVSFNHDKSMVNIYIEQDSDFGNFNSKKSYNYNVSLNDNLLWIIDIDMGAINGTMDFSNLKIGRLDIDSSASNLDLIFGSKGKHTEVEIDGGVSNLQITIPGNLGVRIEADGFINNTNIKKLGWKRIDDYYVSPNYEDSENKLDIDIDTEIGKFDVKMK